MKSSASPVSPHTTTQTSPPSYTTAHPPSSCSTPAKSHYGHQTSSRHATPSGVSPYITSPPSPPVKREWSEPSLRAGSLTPSSPSQHASSRQATPYGTRPSVASPPGLPTHHEWRKPRGESTPPSSPSQYASSRHTTPSRMYTPAAAPSYPYPPLRDEQRHPSLHHGSFSHPTHPLQRASSRHATHGPPSTYPSLPSHPPNHNERRQTSSQPGHPSPSREAARLEPPSYEPYVPEQQKVQKPAKPSKLGGIPQHQLQRIRVADLGTGPSASGTKRTRSPDDEQQPGAKFIAASGNTAGAKKGKGKAKLTPAEEVKQADDRRGREAIRLRSYRNDIESGYDELLMAIYGDEEEVKLTRAAHGKRGCLKKAMEIITTRNAEKVVYDRNVDQLRERVAQLERKLGRDVVEEALGAEASVLLSRRV